MCGTWCRGGRKITPAREAIAPEVQRSLGISGYQYGKDLNRLRTILNAFPRYQHSKLIGPDIRVLQKKEDVEFVTEALVEAGPILDAVTWHPRWPQPSKMKVSDVSELGYEFPLDYIEWDRSQLNRILQRSILKNPIWIGEPKTESTGTFAEGLLWARRLVLAAKLGIEVVMKQPSLMDISHPKPEYWIAFLHKRLLSKSVLETRAANNQTETVVVTHCTNPLFWSEKQNKVADGAITIYAVNMGGKEQKVHIKGTWSGKSQIMLQYLLTSGSDPDSVFSQMTYLNGEPLMMTDDGNLPDIIPRIRRVERGVIFKLPPYSAGFWVVPEARVKICQMQPQHVSSSNFENVSTVSLLKNREKSIPSVRNLNQLIVDKLKNPVSESDEENYDDGIISDDSNERDFTRESSESPRSRSSRRVRQVTVEDIGQELKQKIREIREMLESKGSLARSKGIHSSEALRAAEEKITSLTDELGAATRMTNQHEEFGRFLYQAGLNQDFGALMMNGGREALQGLRRSTSNKNQWTPLHKTSSSYDPQDPKIRRFRRSLSHPEDDYEEESTESYSSEEEDDTEIRPYRKSDHRKRLSRLHEDSDESGDNSNYPGSPSLKGLGEKYKSFISYRIKDGKKKLSDLRRLKKKNETEESKKPGGRKGNNLENDLQEEILIKEVEVLQKTEEAMANLIKNHKKRQQTIEDIILHEISDIKEDRLAALVDMRLNKGTNNENSEELQDIPGEGEMPKKIRRSAFEVLNKNINADVSPKVKRSIGDVDSNLNALPGNSQEEKKLKIIKRSLDSSSYDRAFSRKKSRKANRDDDDNSVEGGNRRFRKTRSERLERMKNFIQSRERIRDRNILRRKSRRSNRKNKAHESDEESHEVLGTYGPEFLDNSEDRVIKEIQKEILKKPERRTSEGEAKQSEVEEISNREQPEKQSRNDEKRNESNSGSFSDSDRTTSGSGNIKKGNEDIRYSKGNSNNVNPNSSDNSSNSGSQNSRPRAEEKRSDNIQESSPSSKMNAKKTKSEEQSQYVPLKIDKNRGLNVLKRISNLVESINTREKSRSRKPSMDVEDLSEEFYGDAISKLTKRRHRRSHHGENEEEEDNTEGGLEGNDFSEVEMNEESTTKDAKALRKEAKLRKLLDRKSRKKKPMEESGDDQSEGKDVAEKATISRLKAKLQARLNRRLQSTAAPRSAEEVTQVIEVATEQTTIKDSTAGDLVGKEKINLQEHSEVEISTDSDMKFTRPSSDEKIDTPTTGDEVKKKEKDSKDVGGREKEKLLAGGEQKDGKVGGPIEEVGADGAAQTQKIKAEEASTNDALEVSTIATTTTTVAASTLPSTEEAFHPSENTREEFLQDPNGLFVIPEIDGLIFNPVVAISPENFDVQMEEEPNQISENPSEGLRSTSDEIGQSDEGSQIVLVNPYIGEEVPLNIDEEIFGGSGSTRLLLSNAESIDDVINRNKKRNVDSYDPRRELTDGDGFKKWKEVQTDDEGEVPDNKSERNEDLLKKRSLTSHERQFVNEEISSFEDVEDVSKQLAGDTLMNTFSHDPAEVTLEGSFGTSQMQNRFEATKLGAIKDTFTGEAKEAENGGTYAGTDERDPSIIEVVPTESVYSDVTNLRTFSGNEEGLRRDDGQWVADKPGYETNGRRESPKSAGFKPSALRRERRGIVDRRMFTPEERIRNFKRLVHRRHSPYSLRNEIPVANERDSFWKMAGSTVKAVFNDVIPEAYGKTKDKIENLGISEYFKEFGKIVEQMKNLDRLFANIGQAAVKNYIKGSEDEKGDFIQVIGKKRRNKRDIEELLIAEQAVTDAPEGTAAFDGASTELDTEATTSVPQVKETTAPSAEVYLVHNEGTTSGESSNVDSPGGNKVKVKGLKKYVKERPNDLIRDIFLMDSNPGIVEVTKSPPTTEPTSTIALQPFEPRYSKAPKLNYFNNGFFKRNGLHSTLRDGNHRLFIDKMMSEREIQKPEMQKLSPWMKTTKEFINQALTTLQRQRELSEMIARESVNDLVKREIERKVVGKRETSEDKVQSNFFPVYQLPSNRKRETYGNSEEDITRYLRQLQPGVYIVPTEEMKNLRSEQIMKEAPETKPGVPNMVTLNIYYDKKKSQEWEESREAVDPSRATSDFARYYETQGIRWSPVPTANHPAADYIPHVSETTLDSRYLSPLQDIAAPHTETRLHEPLNPRILHYPESYPDWVAAAQRGYQVIPRNQQTFYYPGDNQFGQPKSDWTDFKIHQAPVSEVIPLSNSPSSDSGWAVQFQPSKKKPLRSREPLRPADRHLRPFPDKKRSVGNAKTNPNFSGLALPFWKFFVPKRDGNEPGEIGKAVKNESSESDSVEELFAENRKRAKQNAAKQNGGEPKEMTTESEKSESEETKPETETNRRKRDLSQYNSPSTVVEFHDRDLIPEWFGTVQDLDNTLHEEHDQPERLTRVVSIPQSENGEYGELLLSGSHPRSRRSVADKVKILPFNDNLGETKPALTRLDSEDSSLEVPGINGETKSSPKNATKTGNANAGSSDDPLTHFFQYAYDSLIQVMKGMTNFI